MAKVRKGGLSPDLLITNTNIKNQPQKILQHFRIVHHIISSADAFIGLIHTDAEGLGRRKLQIWHDITDCWTKLVSAIDEINSSKSGQSSTGSETPALSDMLMVHYKDEITKMMHFRRKMYPSSLNNPASLLEFICGEAVENRSIISAIKYFQINYENQLRSSNKEAFIEILQGAKTELVEAVSSGEFCSPPKEGVVHDPIVERIVTAYFWTFKAVGILLLVF